MVLCIIKGFSTFTYDHTQNFWKIYFFRYCFQAFSIIDILKNYVNDCFKVNGKQMIKMSKKVSILDSKFWKESKIIIYDLCRFLSTRR